MKPLFALPLAALMATAAFSDAPLGCLPDVIASWQRTGVQPRIPAYVPIVQVALSTAPSEAAANVRRLQRAIDDAPLGTEVQLPAGTFPLGGELYLRTGRVLRGAGSEATTLRFASLPAAYRGYLNFHGTHGRGTAITGGLAQGSTRIEVADNYGIPVGAAIMCKPQRDDFR